MSQEFLNYLQSVMKRSVLTVEELTKEEKKSPAFSAKNFNPESLRKQFSKTNTCVKLARSFGMSEMTKAVAANVDMTAAVNMTAADNVFRAWDIASATSSDPCYYPVDTRLVSPETFGEALELLRRRLLQAPFEMGITSYAVQAKHATTCGGRRVDESLRAPPPDE